MSSKRKLSIVALALLVIVAGFFALRQPSPDREARETLEQLLGQSQEEPLSPEFGPPRSPMPRSAPHFGIPPLDGSEKGGEMPEDSESPLDSWADRISRQMERQMEKALRDFDAGSAITSTMGIPTVDFEETPDAYRLLVPLAKAEDANGVNVQVQPRHIQLSADFTSGTGGFSTRSHMTRSFATSVEVNPDRVTRNYKDGVLTIVIPKLKPGEAPSHGKTPTAKQLPREEADSSRPLPPELREQLYRPDSYI